MKITENVNKEALVAIENGYSFKGKTIKCKHRTNGDMEFVCVSIMLHIDYLDEDEDDGILITLCGEDTTIELDKATELEVLDHSNYSIIGVNQNYDNIEDASVIAAYKSYEEAEIALDVWLRENNVMLKKRKDLENTRNGVLEVIRDAFARDVIKKKKFDEIVDLAYTQYHSGWRNVLENTETIYHSFPFDFLMIAKNLNL